MINSRRCVWFLSNLFIRLHKNIFLKENVYLFSGEKKKHYYGRFLFLKQNMFARIIFLSENHQWFKMRKTLPSTKKSKKNPLSFFLYVLKYERVLVNKWERNKINTILINFVFFRKLCVPFRKPNEPPMLPPTPGGRSLPMTDPRLFITIFFN